MQDASCVVVAASEGPAKRNVAERAVMKLPATRVAAPHRRRGVLVSDAAAPAMVLLVDGGDPETEEILRMWRFFSKKLPSLHAQGVRGIMLLL
jgi:hypothetical protein